jgi:4-hydroxy-3-methylbut-2-enyl diphosphate reductase
VDEYPKVIIAPGAGFCRGVEKAVEKTLHIAKDKENGRIFLDGELVHNREVGDRLRAQGVQLLKENSEVCAADTIVIRAHGISPQRRSHLEHFGCEIVDCTCPLVGRIAKIIADHSANPTILLGDRNHVEVEGLCGYSQNIYVCENLTELTQFIDAIQKNGQIHGDIFDHKCVNFSKMDDWILVCQSTLDMNFLEAAKILCAQKKLPIKIFDTICEATKRRQLGLRTLENCDAVIVIGGFHSANTKRLYEKMKRKMMSIFWIENISDLLGINLNNYKSIGITAGASTSREVLRKIYGEISKK